MAESEDYKLFRKHVPRGSDRVSRIENIVGPGTPDINCCFSGREFWIELKSPTEPKREWTPLFGSNHGLSQDQMNWFLKQRNAGGKGYIIIATDRRWLLIDGEDADSVNEASVGELDEMALWSSRKPLTPFAWQLLRDTLVGR